MIRHEISATIGFLILLTSCKSPGIEELPISTSEILSETTSTSQTTKDKDNRDALPDVSDLMIAYVVGGNIWLWQDSTGALQLNDAGDAVEVVLSDDGEWIAYRRELGGVEQEIWVIDKNGFNNRQVVSWEQIDALAQADESLGIRLGEVSWIPDSHDLIFSTYEVSGEILDDMQVVNYKGSFNYGNHIVSVDGYGSVKPLFEPGEGGKLSFSPDASKVAIVTPTSIQVFSADGAKELLNFPYDTNMYYWDPLQVKLYAKPVWSPDSSMLMVSIPLIPEFSIDEFEEVEPVITEIWILPTNGDSPRLLGAYENYFSDLYHQPTPSPDLKHIIYAMWVDDETELHIMSPVGANDERIAKASFIFLRDWAPDSEKFVFTIEDITGEYKVAWVGETVYVDLCDRKNIADYAWIDDDRIMFTTRPRSDETAELRIGMAGGLSIKVAELSNYFLWADVVILGG